MFSSFSNARIVSIFGRSIESGDVPMIGTPAACNLSRDSKESVRRTARSRLRAFQSRRCSSRLRT
jgi:hypothetical protein